MTSNDISVRRINGGTSIKSPADAAEPGEQVEVWEFQTIFVGSGSLVGWISRDQFFVQDQGESVAHFEIAGEMQRALGASDVALPIVEDAKGEYLPRYPSCPDCGGAVVWAENGRVPGSRLCDGCGSAFADSRYSAVDPKNLPDIVVVDDGNSPKWAADHAAVVRALNRLGWTPDPHDQGDADWWDAPEDPNRPEWPDPDAVADLRREVGTIPIPPEDTPVIRFEWRDDMELWVLLDPD